MDTLTPLRAFRRIVELGSIAKAADALDLSSAALSKQLRALEAHLGAVLLQRTTRRMSLTDTGQAYYAECCRLLDEFDALEQSVRAQSQQVAGRLRVNAPLSFALSTLSPLLARFMQRHPQLQIDLSMEDRLVDAVGQGFDVSIRLSAELARITTDPDFRDRLRQAGVEAQTSTADELRAFVDQQLVVWGTKVKDAGIQPE